MVISSDHGPLTDFVYALGGVTDAADADTGPPADGGLDKVARPHVNRGTARHHLYDAGVTDRNAVLLLLQQPWQRRRRRGYGHVAGSLNG